MDDAATATIVAGIDRRLPATSAIILPNTRLPWQQAVREYDTTDARLRTGASIYVLEAVARPVSCPICGGERSNGGGYPNEVCEDCDRRAVNADGEEPWHGWPPGEEPESEPGVIQTAPDHGENPVFIAGQKCWRRYRFGGWVTMVDEHDCDSLEEFYEAHGMM